MSKIAYGAILEPRLLPATPLPAQDGVQKLIAYVLSADLKFDLLTDGNRPEICDRLSSNYLLQFDSLLLMNAAPIGGV